MLGASACGGSSPSGPSQQGQSPMASVQYVSVTGGFAVASAGATTQLRANANTSSGFQDVTGQATWTTSNDSLATVSSGGVVTARGGGLVVITASYQGLSGSAGIAVATPVNVSGTWRGATTNPSSSVEMQLTQAGDSLTGSSAVLSSDGSSYKGTLSGTVNGGTLILAGSVSATSGGLFGTWSDERCALENANSMRCLNPMTDARGNFTRTEASFTRQ